MIFYVRFERAEDAPSFDGAGPESFSYVPPRKRRADHEQRHTEPQTTQVRRLSPGALREHELEQARQWARGAR